MKICPKCKGKNEDSSRFCKECGTQLSAFSFQDKKEKVMEGGKKRLNWVFLSLIVVAVGLAGIAYWLIQVKATSNPKVGSQPKVAGKVNYLGQNISMTDIPLKVANGKIAVPLNTVLEKKFVRFEFEGNGVKIPLLAYITMAGRVVTAVSMCEPCRSTRFHIKDRTLVCNACYTEWNLETLKGISGGCMNYPPEVIPSTVEKDQILIDEKVVLDWKPRV